MTPKEIDEIVKEIVEMIKSKGITVDSDLPDKLKNTLQQLFQ